MKNLSVCKMETLGGGYVCLVQNGNGIGQCYPALCLFVGGILAGTPAQAEQFQVCPL